MNRRRCLRNFLLGLVFLTGFPPLPAWGAETTDRWEETIRQFEQSDREKFPEPGVIVFIGSSSIRAWETLQEDLAPLKVLNRGFGGSEIRNSVKYAPRIVIPCKPSRVLLYAGDNDIAGGKSAETVLADFKEFTGVIHAALPEVPVYFISIKPSLARWKLWPEMKRANRLVEKYCAETPEVEYLDVASAMLGEDGTPRKDIFVEDGLHLNAAGYKIWTAIIKPRLEKTLEEK